MVRLCGGRKRLNVDFSGSQKRQRVDSLNPQGPPGSRMIGPKPAQDRTDLFFGRLGSKHEDVSLLAVSIPLAVKGSLRGPPIENCRLQRLQRDFFSLPLEDLTRAAGDLPGAAIGLTSEISRLDPGVGIDGREAIGVDKAHRAVRAAEQQLARIVRTKLDSKKRLAHVRRIVRRFGRANRQAGHGLGTAEIVEDACFGKERTDGVELLLREPPTREIDAEDPRERLPGKIML